MNFIIKTENTKKEIDAGFEPHKTVIEPQNFGGEILKTAVTLADFYTPGIDLNAGKEIVYTLFLDSKEAVITSVKLYPNNGQIITTRPANYHTLKYTEQSLYEMFETASDNLDLITNNLNDITDKGNN